MFEHLQYVVGYIIKVLRNLNIDHPNDSPPSTTPFALQITWIFLG